MEVLVNGMNFEVSDIQKKSNVSTIQNISIPFFGRSGSQNELIERFGKLDSLTLIWIRIRAIMMQQNTDPIVQMDSAVMIIMKIASF